MANEVYEFLLSLSAAQYRAGLNEAEIATTQFANTTKTELTKVNGAIAGSSLTSKKFAENYIKYMKAADDATQIYAKNVVQSVTLIDRAYGTLGANIEKRILAMTMRSEGFSKALTKLNTDAAGELRGLSSKMIAASNDTDAYTNSLKSMSASARNATAALKALNNQNATPSGSPGFGSASQRSGSPGTSSVKIPTPAELHAEKIDAATKSLKKFQSELNSATQGAKDLSLASFTAFTGIGLAIAAPTKAFIDYEKAVNMFQAVTLDSGKTANAVAEELRKFKEVSFELGSTTQFSAKAVASAAVELGKLGYTASQAIAVLPSVVNAATAGQVDLAKAAEYVTAALNGFQLIAGKNVDVMKESTHVADLFAKAAAMSAVDFSDLGETFKYVSSIAYSSGQSIEDMTATIGIMGQNMIKGSQAGTSLRQALLSLQRPTKAAREVFDILKINPLDGKGELKRLPLFLREMRASLQGVETSTKNAAVSAVFGREALSGMLSVMNTSDENFNKFLDGMQNVDGASKKMADISFKGLSAEVKKLLSTLETAGIKMGEAMSPDLIKLTKELSDFIKAVDGMPNSLKQVIGSTLIFTGKLSLLLGVVFGGKALFGFLTGAVIKFIGANNLARLGLLASKIAFEAQFAQMVLMTNGFAGLGASAKLFGASVVSASATAGSALMAMMPQIAIVAAALAAAYAVVESIKNTLAEGVASEQIDAAVTETAKQGERAAKAYNKLQDIFKKNPGKNIQTLLTTGKMSEQDLLEGTAGLQNVANQSKGTDLGKALLMTADSWRQIAKDFRTQKSDYDAFLADQEQYMADLKEISNAPLESDVAMLKEKVAKQRPELQQRIKDLKAKGFNLEKLEYLEKRQAEIDEKIGDPLKEATKKGKDGESSGRDKVLEALNKEFDLMVKTNDVTLESINIKQDWISVTKDQTKALKTYSDELALMEYVTGLNRSAMIRHESHGYKGAFDWGTPVGTPIKSPYAGKIKFAANDGGAYGNLVSLDIGGGKVINMAHLSKINVRQGQNVSAGEVVGLSGGAAGAPGAGNSEGPHLHLDLKINGQAADIQQNLGSMSGMVGSELSINIDPAKLKMRDDKINAMIANLEVMKQKFLKGGYENEAASVEQKISDLRKKLISGQEDYAKQLADIAEENIKQQREMQEKIAQSMLDFHEDLKTQALELNKEISQQFMSESEKALDDSNRAVLALEKKVSDLQQTIRGANVTEAFRGQALEDIKKFTDQINELISAYATLLARSDFDNQAENTRQLLEQIEAYESRLISGAGKIANAEKELEMFGPGGLQRDNNEQLTADLKAKLEKWKSEREGYKKHLEKLKKQRADAFKDQADEQERQFQKLNDAEKDAFREKEIEAKMKKLEEGPQIITDQDGRAISFKTQSTSDIKRLLEARLSYANQQKELFIAGSTEEEKKTVEYKNKINEFDEKRRKIASDILMLEIGMSEENSKILGNIILQNQKLENASASLEIMSNILKGVGNFFSSFDNKASQEFGQAVSFIGESADVVSKAFKNFKEKDWISASIATALDVLPMIAKGIGLFPKEADIRKEKLQYETMMIDAEISVQRARLEARKAIGEEGTKAYYEELRKVEADEHKKNMAQLEVQMLEQLEKNKGFVDVLDTIFAMSTKGVNEYGYTFNKATGKMFNQNAQAIVDAYKKNVSAEEMRYETGKTKTDVDQIVSQNQIVARSRAILLARTKRTGNNAGNFNTKVGDIITASPMDALGETPESIKQEYSNALQDIEDKRKEIKSKYKENSAEYLISMSELDEQTFSAYEKLLNQTKQYEDTVRQLVLSNEQLKVDSIQGGLDKRLQAQALASSQEMKTVKDRMAVLEFYNLKESDEYKALEEKKVLLTQKSTDERLQIEKDYRNEVRALNLDIATAAAGLTAGQKDDIDAEFDNQMKSLSEWRDKMRKDFPELKPEINKSFRARRNQLKLDRDYKKLEDDEAIKGEFRSVLMAEADATDSMLDNIKQEYSNALADIDSQEKLALANHKLTEEQKLNASRKAAADRVKSHKAMIEKIKGLAMDEFNMLKKIREMQFKAQTKDREDAIRGYKSDLDKLDIQLRQQELAINRIKQAGETRKAGLNENDLQRFEQAQAGINLQEQTRKALLFGGINLTGNVNDAAARQTQQEAMDAYAEFLIQKAETDRMLKVITGEQMAGQLQNVALMQASFAQSQLAKVNEFYDAQITQMQAAGNSSEEIDIHNRKRDKEIELLRKKYAESFERYKELEIQAVDEQVAKDTESMNTQLENDRLRRESIALNLEQQQIALDELRLKYEQDIQKIDDAMTKLENAHLGMDTTFKQLESTMKNGVTSAIDQVIQRYKDLTKSAKEASAAGVAGGAAGSVGGSYTYNKSPIKNTGQSYATMAAQGYYTTDGDYWFATDKDLQHYQAYGLKDGAVMPDRPWMRGKDGIGPFMLDDGEEVVSRKDRMSLIEHIRSEPNRVMQSSSIDQSRVDRSLTIHNTIGSQVDINRLMNDLERWYRGKQISGSNQYGYLSR